MAKRTITALTDDINGSEASETVSFGLEGTTYDIGLNDVHAEYLRKVPAPFISVARTVGASRRWEAWHGAGGAVAARHRLAELDAAPVQEPAAPVVRGFADMWSTLSVEVRRDVAGALLTSVRVRQDKTVEIRPRWGEPVIITFTKRGSVPHLLSG